MQMLLMFIFWALCACRRKGQTLYAGQSMLGTKVRMAYRRGGKQQTLCMYGRIERAMAVEARCMHMPPLSGGHSAPAEGRAVEGPFGADTSGARCERARGDTLRHGAGTDSRAAGAVVDIEEATIGIRGRAACHRRRNAGKRNAQIPGAIEAVTANRETVVVGTARMHGVSDAYCPYNCRCSYTCTRVR